jgi:membrane protease YdiL (CAAX protease family)
LTQLSMRRRGEGSGSARRRETPGRRSVTATSSGRLRPASGRGRAPRYALGSLGRGDVATSLVIVFPALLVYQLAIVFVPSVVAVDAVSRALYGACGGRGGYLLVQAALAGAFLLWIHRSGRAGSLSGAVIAPVLAESGGIAALLWLGLPLLVHHALGLGVGASVASALGAGIYEELVFRLLLLGGALRVALACGLSRGLAAALAVTVSALAFAAAHHLGGAAEPWHGAALAFRVLAGLALGATLWFRSLAHAVYAHIGYDLLVLLT